MSNPFTPVLLRGDGNQRVVKGQVAGHAAAHRQDLIESNAFAPLRQGNKVECFTTGKAYFAALAKAMKSAQKSIFIAGWQVNWDVELTEGERLIDILHDRVQSSDSFRVYVMPWMSPKVGVNTGDLGTMLAVFQLNAGRKTMQAICCPAGAQSDYKGSEGAAFSHHQKMIVIDNKIGFVGGIDVAYGRCDDEQFSLDPGGRKFNERYNPSIPPMMEVTPDYGQCVSDMDLLATTLTFKTWEKGGNTEPGALSQALQRATDIADRLAVDAVRLVNETLKLKIQLDNAAVRAGAATVKAVGDAGKSVVRGGADVLNAGAEVAVEAAKRVSFTCARLETPDLYNSVKSAKVGAAPTSSIPGMLRDVEERARAEYNETVDRAARFLAPLAQLRINPKAQSSIPSAIDGAERTVRRGANAIIDGAAYAAGGAQRGIEMSRQVCVEIGPVVERRVHGAREYIKQTGQELVSGINAYQLAIIEQINTVRSAFNAKLEAMKRMAMIGRDEAISNIDQQTIQAIIDQYAKLCRQVYIAQLALSWKKAARHDLLLQKKTKAAAAKVLAKDQPREPWQDVHCQIEGPSVDDLSLNFIRRWNACNVRYLGGKRGDDSAGEGLQSLLKLALIEGELVPKPRPAQGAVPPSGVAVRVLRSAPHKLCKEEADALKSKVLPTREQKEIETAMVRLIQNATDFIYIENQFFQTAFGKPSIDPFTKEGIEQQSGPIKYLMSQTGNNLTARISSAGDAKGKKLLPANDIGEALGDRIGQAIRFGQPFHVYLVLPVHPEGKLSDIAIVGQIHWTMQSLVFAENSLVNRVRRALMAKRICKTPLNSEAWKSALLAAGEIKGKQPAYSAISSKEWAKYLTLLNLRSCEVLDGQLRTEQVYVHSKLLIVDDRHIIMGSANINDRSLSGKRDSEIAVMLLDNSREKKRIHTEETHVHVLARKLRVDLWNKHFALAKKGKSIVKPAAELAAFVEQPASETAIKEIQKIALRNAAAYRGSFDFVPWSEGPSEDSDAKGASIWPVCEQRGSLDEAAKVAQRMPFSEDFWKKRVGQLKLPVVKGFICALPVNWTVGENNQPGEMNVMLLTQHKPDHERSQANA
jgi:phospholipase D1/2